LAVVVALFRARISVRAATEHERAWIAGHAARAAAASRAVATTLVVAARLVVTTASEESEDQEATEDHRGRIAQVTLRKNLRPARRVIPDEVRCRGFEAAKDIKGCRQQSRDP